MNTFDNSGCASISSCFDGRFLKFARFDRATRFVFAIARVKFVIATSRFVCGTELLADATEFVCEYARNAREESTTANGTLGYNNPALKKKNPISMFNTICGVASGMLIA